jgi:Tfp pilus assembly protein PilF
MGASVSLALSKLEKTGDYTRAIADIETALRIDPNNTNARRSLELVSQLVQ